MTHRSWECDKITSSAERHQILQNKWLCFNCTGPKHSANNCSSRASCVHCKQKHHSSICDRQVRASQPRNNAGVALTATQGREKNCHPIVLVKVNGVTCRALLDTGATVSYVLFLEPVTVNEHEDNLATRSNSWAFNLDSVDSWD